MTGFGQGARGNPRTRGRTGLRSGPDRATLGIIGVVCAIAGFFVLGIVLGPAAVVCGWLAMGRSFSARPATALVALVLGAIDTLLAIIWLAGAAGGAGGLF